MINYVDFRYSKDKGKTKAGDVFNSALNMGPSDTFYTDSLVDGEIIAQSGTSTDIDVNLPWYPVLLKTVTIEVNGEVGICDPATGAVSGLTGITGSVLPSGKVALDLHTASTTLTTDMVITYRFDNESVQSDGPEAAGFTNVNSIASLYGNIH